MHFIKIIKPGKIKKNQAFLMNGRYSHAIVHLSVLFRPCLIFLWGEFNLIDFLNIGWHAFGWRSGYEGVSFGFSYSFGKPAGPLICSAFMWNAKQGCSWHSKMQHGIYICDLFIYLLCPGNWPASNYLQCLGSYTHWLFQGIFTLSLCLKDTKQPILV